MKKLLNKENFIYTFLTLLAVLAGFIWTFTNVGIDATYQVSMAYRIIKGDAMFLEMWEPHQTSTFINVFFMWPFIKITGGVTGVVIYLQAIGLIIRALVAVSLYRCLKEDLPKPVIFGISILLFMVSPKDLAIADYSNMQLWFEILIFICLIKYVKKGKLRYVIFTALALCFQVISYPSCLIVYIAVAALMLIYGKKERRVRDIGLLTLICLCLGATVAFTVVWPLGLESFKEAISGMLSLEPSHTVSFLTKALKYLKNLWEIVLCYIVVGVVSLILSIFKKDKKEKGLIFLFTSTVVLFIGFLINIFTAENRCAYGVIFLYVIFVGIILSKGLKGIKKTIYVMGTILSLTCLLATTILTNLELVVSLPYTILAVSMALIPIYEYIKGLDDRLACKSLKIFRSLAIVFVLLLTFRALYIRTPIHGYSQITASIKGLALVRKGPAAGIITNDDSAERERDGIKDFEDNLEAGDKIMVIGGTVDDLTYLYTDTEICTPSLVPDPKYSENFEKYFELNPDKMPDVVIVSSYEGQMDYDMSCNEWVNEWIGEEFDEKVVYGKYWTFYYRKK